MRIAQITDTHLYADPGGRLMGIETRRSLEEVVALARARRPGLIVASGDLSHDGSPSSYHRLRECLAPLGAPVCCLPGNHDEAAVMRRILDGDGFRCIDSLCTNGWNLVFLDSTLRGSEGGHLAERQLHALEQALAGHPELPALIWLHHQPLPVGSAWLDTMAVDNPDQLFAVTDRHPQVRAIVWGHVHQCFDDRRKGVRLLAAPSTCIQFLPRSRDFALDDRPPGYRWLELYPDGTMETGVERLARMPGVIDTAARGY
ncbi:MAG TPA: 3',5'-cyclic-AMP phosphodiesterase [Gammaproteobacteria bacterium]|nr:3',5'-cyclic-AMP phosphodiesterase [Gammaproteobacteria bacterium]